MSTPLPSAVIPYGIRDVKLTPYLDAEGTQLDSTSVDLPYGQTFSFSEAEDFEELRGDDRLVTTHGSGPTVEWELESGGISFAAWAVMSGGAVIEGGTAPDRTVTMRKMGGDVRPRFRVEGQAISDSGGDIHVFVYRCRCNDTIEGEFGDGEFFVTNPSGIGTPMPDDSFDILYDFIQNETAVTIDASTPTPNPTAPTG